MMQHAVPMLNAMAGNKVEVTVARSRYRQSDHA
jgi:hypothetical protein